MEVTESDVDLFTNISVPRYYEGKSIFVTGGSGFIGKVLIEKLLRGCPALKSIYMLIRPKKGLTCEERIEKFFKLPLFTTLMELYPDSKNKIIIVPGDITHQGLGISCEDRQMICENVEILIHSAATVRFDEPLRVAMEMNVIAVKEIIKLAKEMKCLDVFCHVSTAYTQCNLTKEDVIEEKFYPVICDPEKLLDAMSWMSDDMLNALTKPLLDRYPNTYTFTKGLAEHILQTDASDLPLVIVRPSIVCASISDPMPGWIDNYNGISGIIALVGRGVLRTIHASDCKHDMVPVDLVSNCIAAAVWYHGVSRPKKPIIINCTSGNVNPTCFLSMQDVCLSMLWEYPYNSIFRRPNFAFTCSGYINRYWQVISHYIPAVIADGLAVLMGSKPRLVTAYRSIDRNIDTMQFFVLNEWQWGNTEFMKVFQALLDTDRENFDFDMRCIDWHRYYQKICLGVKMYLIKDDMKELPKAKRLHQRYKLVRWLSSTLFVLLAGRFFFVKSERFRKLWFEALFGIYRFLQIFRITSVHT